MADGTTDPIAQAAESLLIYPNAKPETEPQNSAPEPVEADETAQDEAVAVEAEAPEGDASEAVEDEGQEEQAPSVFTVKVDGKDVEATLDDLKRAYSGQAYIQKGMQDAAAAKKEAAALYEALQTEQAKFLQVVQTVQQQGFIAPPKAPDVALSHSDPIGYLQQRAEYEAQAQAYQAQQSQLTAVQRQQHALQEAAQAQYIPEQRRLLAEKIPDFSDTAKAPEIQAKLRKVGVEVYGFTDDEIGGVTDARHVQVLHDAMKWRELQAGKAGLKAQPMPPKTLKPQARLPQPPQLARAKQLEIAKKTGDLRQIAAAALLTSPRR